MEVFIQEVDPELAIKLLGKNYEKQRNINKNWANDLAREMSDGRWRECGDNQIVIDVNGNLINGQHRMLAVIKSGTTQKFLFQTGVPTDYYDVMDTNRKRSVADAIGGKNRNSKSAIASFGAGIQRGLRIEYCMVGQRVTKTESIEYYNENAQSLEIVSDYFEMFKRSIGKAAPLGVGAAMWIYWNISPEIVEYAVEDIRNDVPQDQRVATYKTQCMKEIIRENFDKERQFAMTIRLFEAIKDDKDLPKRINSPKKIIETWQKKINLWRNNPLSNILQ